jgi:hypothetical protein
MVYQAKVQNMDNLKEGIRDARPRITPNMLKRVRRKWESRFSVSCQCNGVHTKHFFARFFLNKQTILPTYVYFWIALYNIVDSLVSSASFLILECKH